MKISQLIAINKKPYYESVANRLPRGIKTQQQLLNIGYKIAVEDLGLAKAKTLNENFAAKLVNSYHTQCLDEGVGSFLGRAAGHTVGAVGAAGRGIAGGIAGAWKDAKQGYKDAKKSWDPKTDTSAPSPGGNTPTPPTAGTPLSATSGAEDPTALRAQAAELTQKADEIEKQAAEPVSGSDRPYVAPPAGKVEPTLDTPAGTTPPVTAPAPTAPAPSKVNYSGIPKAAPLPKATPSQGAYNVKSAYGQPAPAAAPSPAAPQFKGPKVNGLQVRNMGEGKKLKFRSNFLGIDL